MIVAIVGFPRNIKRASEIFSPLCCRGYFDSSQIVSRDVRLDPRPSFVSQSLKLYEDPSDLRDQPLSLTEVIP